LADRGRREPPCHPDWIRWLRDQCAGWSVPYFFKQWGEWAPGDERKVDGICSTIGWEHVGKKPASRLLDGREYSEFPA